ncbi:hypothetical protein, partial [Phascolarctobacterium faecium]|uniref:hypothetical protein n=1 Tax=Phascolarctobacterium faecium TaxID=33025 RepID=UPI00307DD724
MPKKKVLMAVLALIFAVMQILPAFANELEDKQAEYDDVQQKMQQMEIAKERARNILRNGKQAVIIFISLA